MNKEITYLIGIVVFCILIRSALTSRPTSQPGGVRSLAEHKNLSYEPNIAPGENRKLPLKNRFL